MQIQARNMFPPERLTQHLKLMPDGTVVVDKESAITTPFEQRLFNILMNCEYGWEYSDPQNTTIYFEVSNDMLWGGAYNMRFAFKSQLRLIAATNVRGVVGFRTYSKEEMRNITNNVPFKKPA